MDPNTWYFTLSALAQVLGSILGLNAIFVAVKLEHITKEVNYYKRRGASILKWEKKEEADKGIRFDAIYILKKLHVISNHHRDDPAFVTHLEHALKHYDPVLRATPDRAIRFLDDTISSLEDNLKQKKRMIHSVILPSVVNMLAIFVSLLMMGFTDYFIKQFPANLELLIGIIIISVLGMYLIAVSSYRILWSIE